MVPFGCLTSEYQKTFECVYIGLNDSALFVKLCGFFFMLILAVFHSACNFLHLDVNPHQGPVVQKPFNANPRLKINRGVYFSTSKTLLIFGKILH